VRPLRYVLHEHAARTHHFDLRLELGGVLLSWAVPKGPSLDPADKRLAVRVEDHPLAYGAFEGEIPEGRYGAGRVRIADRGSWVPDEDPAAMLAAGKLAFEIRGGRYAGRWALVRLRKAARGGAENWLLIRRSTPTRSSSTRGA
jgi:bifunctional non-homologous end joining protein LigD